MERFKREDVFTVLNAADAEEYIDTVGYFAERLSELNANIEDGITDTLTRIETDNCFSFVTGNDNFPLFLPASKTITPYRPFECADEFIAAVLGGNRDGWLCMRHKANGHENTNTNEWYRKLQEYSPTQKQVSFGQQLNYSFEALFLKWEWKDAKGNWRVFGVRA
jgi:crotonobetainyl-CoA:carnitine CoA-transferase CaiB-like acyl-CoA transferase